MTMNQNKRMDPLEKWLDVVEELRNQTDRGLAVVGATIVEEQLKSLILRGFTKVNQEVRRMFDPDHALGSFSPKIRLAYAVGFVSHAVYCDLDLIRQIRNRFAHCTHYAHQQGDPEAIVTFEHKTIRSWASSLRAPIELGIVEASTPRAKFAHTCNRLQVMFSVALNPDEDGGNIPVEYVPSDVKG
jgi:DNA-binding MltR family transcriptional regulator